MTPVLEPRRHEGTKREKSLQFHSAVILLLLPFVSSCLSGEFVAAADLDTPPERIGKRKSGADWPQMLGSTRDSKSSETGLITKWPAGGPRLVWSRPVGTGYSVGSTAYGRLYQFDKIGEKATLECLNAETGEKLWDFAYPSTYEDLYGYNDGPRCAPVIDGNRVYLYGVEGMLHCVSATNGDLIWKVDTLKDFGVIQNFFGVGSGPIVEGDLLLVMVGGSPESAKLIPPGQLDRIVGNGSGIVAFDKRTGKVRYQISDELASYASLQTATIDGRRWAFAFCRGGLLAFEPATGKIDFHYPWRDSKLESVNASTPVVVGNQVFISETYGPGSSLLEVSPGSYKVLWKDDPKRRAKAMQTHWNTPVHHEGYLYGSSGRHDSNAELRCITWKTGEIQWTHAGLARTSLLYVDGHFVVLGEFGELHLMQATAESFTPMAKLDLSTLRAAPPRASLREDPYWSAPILSHGLLYVRGEGRLLCFELIK